MITTPLWILITVQIGLGAFDTLFHHEFGERLAWRQSQRRELQLHGARNLFYALLLAGIGFLELFGVLAWIVAVILVLKLCVTLVDFVEEDRTRKLPASERVTHTLMALNYGAILALLAPVLAQWAGQPTGLRYADHGLWAVLMTLAAFGVTLFGIRDLFASRRLARMAPVPVESLLAGTLPRQAVLVTGGTGFIGRRLVAALAAQGHDLTVLTRDLEKASELAPPVRIITDLDQIDDETPIDAIVNLAGEPLAGWLWTEAHKREVVNSRLEMTCGLVALVKRLRRKPLCFISSSAVRIYGIGADKAQDEESPLEDDGSFSHRSCAICEAAAAIMVAQGVRTVCLRTGLVLDSAGGAFGQMLIPFELGVGGPFGSGRHWMSWITRDDLVRLIAFCIGNAEIEGPVNATAPTPDRNRDFAKALGRALRRPALLPLPEWAIRGALGQLGQEIFLGSQNVRPTKALAAGFTFQAETIDEAFYKLLPPPLKAAHRLRKPVGKKALPGQA